MMKKMRCIAITLWLLLLPVLAYPGQNGMIEGRLVNGTDPAIVTTGVEVDIIGMGGMGGMAAGTTGAMGVIKSSRTDSSGRFRIEGLPEETMMMVRANYRDASYHAAAALKDGKASVEIKVYEPTSSMKDIAVVGVWMAFQLSGDGLKSIETITISNQTKPPRTFVDPGGTFRFSKAPGILELPQIGVTGPGSAMPVRQSAVESADGKSYYSLYPVRPGTTTFEVQQLLPYANRTYAYRKTFYQDTPSINIGIIPQDVTLSGAGIAKIQTDAEKNFSVYATPPIKAGDELTWRFSGGTPVVESTEEEDAGAQIEPRPTVIGRNALIIGPLLLLGFIAALWFAFIRSQAAGGGEQAPRRERATKREQLIGLLAELDYRHETDPGDLDAYRERREELKQSLRRLFLLSSKR